MQKLSRTLLVSTGCGRKRRSVRAWRWICGVKPKPKAVNKPLHRFILHGLYKPGFYTTVSIFPTFSVEFNPSKRFSSPPLRFVSYTPLKPGESFKEASKYKRFQRIVVLCSKTTGTPLLRSFARIGRPNPRKKAV